MVKNHSHHCATMMGDANFVLFYIASSDAIAFPLAILYVAILVLPNIGFET